MNSALERPVAIDGRLKRAFDSSLLARRLREACRGDVLFDAVSRGRYATDASIYQIDPIGVVVPCDEEDVRAALGGARERGVPVLRRGAGSAECGQTVGDALLSDHSKSLGRFLECDDDSM